MTLGNILAWEWSTAKNRNNVILPWSRGDLHLKQLQAQNKTTLLQTTNLALAKGKSFCMPTTL